MQYFLLTFFNIKTFLNSLPLCGVFIIFITGHIRSNGYWKWPLSDFSMATPFSVTTRNSFYILNHNQSTCRITQCGHYKISQHLRLTTVSGHVILKLWKLREFLLNIRPLCVYSAECCGRNVELHKQCWAFIIAVSFFDSVKK